MIMSLIVPGTGNMYLYLVKRGVLQFFVFVFIYALIFYTSSGIINTILWAVYVLWVLETLLDTYHCYNALDNNMPIPKLLNILDI